MIGGINKGSDFAGCVRYALSLDESGNEARLLHSEGVLTDIPQDIIDGFECQRHLNSRIRHWCRHISLSYSPKDKDRMTDEFMVKLALEYTNGISLTSDDPTFSTAVVIVSQTKGMLNLPNNVIRLGYVKTDKGDDYLIEHLGNFIIFLKRLCINHSIQHLAIAFSKEHYDTPCDVRTADITCIGLY